ncbi:TRAP transporter small permease [Aurantimonas sp. MSK8Z-1]|uniref:TRAP transporter small permease n=1 Tax=Mangrovibrevibacter kandeliae TaxID=2968473 RepID=UPI002119304D|nr:TRAP transporter small permease [Aurantimonas sp. MSK8Z-1]MCW4114512.1 TRAP transporter small permease [Aurantimonas sp. MSK8Z-1]
MSQEASAPQPGAAGLAARIVLILAAAIRYWALLGGLLITALALLTTYSALAKLLFDAPFAADYELAKYMTAIAIFAFLPYCQLTGANVTVDIFTEGMSAPAKAAMAMFSALFAVAFSILLLRQMYFGFQSYMRFTEVTPVLKLPIWTAFPPILFSLFLLFVAALVTLVDGVRVMRKQEPYVHPFTGQPIE